GFEGRFFRFASIDAHPRPVQRPHPPIVVGGMSEFGARRAARFGNGWYGFLTDLEATRRSLGWIRGFVAEGLRPPDLGEVEISVTPPPPLTADSVKQYEDIGVHRPLPARRARTLDEGLRAVEERGKLVGASPASWSRIGARSPSASPGQRPSSASRPWASSPRTTTPASPSGTWTWRDRCGDGDRRRTSISISSSPSPARRAARPSTRVTASSANRQSSRAAPARPPASSSAPPRP